MKILILSALIFLMHTSEAFIYSSNLHDNEYVNSCTETGSKVCMNCKTVGICTQSGPTFVVDVSETCAGQETCYPPTGADAICSLVSPGVSPECLCGNGNACEIDPSDNLSYVICTTDLIAYGTCDAGYEFDLINCVCGPSGGCPTCGAYSNSNTDCSSYIDCSTGSSIEMRCPLNYCFNPTDCKCYVECPACGYLPDPDNSPSGFIKCKDMTRCECPGGQVFDNENCICITSSKTYAKFVNTKKTYVDQ